MGLESLPETTTVQSANYNRRRSTRNYSLSGTINRVCIEGRDGCFGKTNTQVTNS